MGVMTWQRADAVGLNWAVLESGRGEPRGIVGYYNHIGINNDHQKMTTLTAKKPVPSSDESKETYTWLYTVYNSWCHGFRTYYHQCK